MFLTEAEGKGFFKEDYRRLRVKQAAIRAVLFYYYFRLLTNGFCVLVRR